MAFREVKDKAISNLLTGNFGHAARADASEKNLLLVNKITVSGVIELLKRCRGNEYSRRFHHQDASVVVHVIVTKGMYIKFYFLPDTMFISVHDAENAK